MDKIFLLTETHKKDWALKAWNDNGVNGEIIYKTIPKPLRLIRRFIIKYDCYIARWFYNDWREKVKKSDIVIVHISSLTLKLPKYINLINPQTRVIAWYWNCVNSDTLPELIEGECEKWSFDPQNCLEYNLKYNHQYYFYSYVKKNEDVQYDMFFCGSDVGRGKELTDLYLNLKGMGFKVCMKIVGSNDNSVTEEIKVDRPLDYSEIVNYNASSKAIIELLRDGQSGATIRMMESMYFQKKLITNNKNIKYEKIYNENNIFIIGEKSLSELSDFMNKPFVPYEKKYLDDYEFHNWINKFVNNKEDELLGMVN